MSLPSTSSTAAKLAGIVITGALLLGGCAQSPTESPGQGDPVCEEPRVSVEPESAPAGETVILSGEAWAPCNDTPNDASEAPWTEVDVTANFESGAVALGAVPVADGAFSTEIVIPKDTPAGPATIRVSASGFDVVVDVIVTK